MYPTSRIVNGAFQSGKTLEFNWRSDKHRHVLLRSSRLVVHMEHKFGEVDSTALDRAKGAQDSDGAPPSKNLMLATLPGTTLFGTGQARYVLNSVVVTNQNHLLDSSLTQLLLTSNNDGPSTAGSNMMTSTRKDTGLASAGFFVGSERKDLDQPSLGDTAAENYTLLPLVKAPYIGVNGARHVLSADMSLSELGAKGALADTLLSFPVETGGAIGTDTLTILTSEYNQLVAAYGQTGGVANVTAITVHNSHRGSVTPAVLTHTVAATAITIKSITQALGLTTITLDNGTFATPATTVVELALLPAGGNPTLISFAGAPGNLETVTFGRMAEAFAIKMKASAIKNTTPNPRVEILQQGYNPGTKTCVTQTSEPLLLDVWNTPYAVVGCT